MSIRLSPHFTLAEMAATSVRTAPNAPSLEEYENLVFLCARLLEPLRARFGPLYTTSGYRSPAVNRIIGGSKTSAHMKGCAWDGVPLRSNARWADIIDYALGRDDLPLDQIIYEYGRWLHVGTRPRGEGCRRQALMIFDRKYEPWNPKDSRVLR